MLDFLTKHPAEPAPAHGRCRGCETLIEPRALFGRWMQPELCPACSEAAEALQIAEARRAVYAAWLAKAGITEFEATLKFDLIDPLQRLVAQDKPAAECAVYLCGPVGSGKTTQAVMAAKARIWREVRALEPMQLGAEALERWGPSVRVVTELEFLAAMQPGPAQQDIGRFANAGFLVLDELGDRRTTAFSGAQLSHLINTRYRLRRPTVFTSNYTLAGLARHPVYDDKLVSRIGEMIGETSYQAMRDRTRQIVQTYSHRLDQHFTVCPKSGGFIHEGAQ